MPWQSVPAFLNCRLASSRRCSGAEEQGRSLAVTPVLQERPVVTCRFTRTPGAVFVRLAMSRRSSECCQRRRTVATRAGLRVARLSRRRICGLARWGRSTVRGHAEPCSCNANFRLQGRALAVCRLVRMPRRSSRRLPRRHSPVSAVARDRAGRTPVGLQGRIAAFLWNATVSEVDYGCNAVRGVPRSSQHSQSEQMRSAPPFQGSPLSRLKVLVVWVSSEGPTVACRAARTQEHWSR